ncbi:histidine phosphatase family protein [Xanthovirga aplysinae]|uniref:histidine phosphatase family protein n=1 Tax=Xanthovirga aplysinae TaxID=2529853 RepID=UPI0012BC65F9|nr:histidine phosphatase family protein [Xanthovirga aplysinae]MTI33207.1 histidine phosphatase family protein [Xanthovirga aplysinae]
METKNLFLIRHGQTEYNRKNIVQGSGIDAPLNEEGRRQAEYFFQAYGDHPFDKVYTSNLQRTVQSVQNFIAKGVPHEKLGGLNEIHWGEKEGQPFSSASQLVYERTTKAWREGELACSLPGGETPLQVVERQKKALKHIMGQNHEKEILICMHGRAMRIFLCLLLKVDLRLMDSFDHVNLGLYHLCFQDGSFSLCLKNDQSHLVALCSN